MLERGGDGGFDARVIVPVNRRPPRADEVDELAVVGRDERGATRGLHEKRRAADGAEGADGRVDTAGDELEGAGEEGVGGLVLHGKFFRNQETPRLPMESRFPSGSLSLQNVELGVT